MLFCLAVAVVVDFIIIFFHFILFRLHVFARFALLQMNENNSTGAKQSDWIWVFFFAFSHHSMCSNKRQNKCIHVCHCMQFINVYNFIFHKYCILRWQAKILYALGNHIIYRFLNKYYANCFVDQHPHTQLNSIPTWNDLCLYFSLSSFYQLRNKTKRYIRNLERLIKRLSV